MTSNGASNKAFNEWVELRSEETKRVKAAKNEEISLFDALEEPPVSEEKQPSEAPFDTVQEEIVQEVSVEEAQNKVNFTFPEEEIYPKTPREKVHANIEAIELVKRLDEESRLATPSEQQVLAKYVGWGGIANQFFDTSNPVFEKERNTLKQHVSLAEYSAMRESSLTAYYTDPRLIQEMYASIEQLGFTGGNILDPSMGTGNFFSALPEALQDNSELYGVELDKITGQIAKQLHQDTNIQVTGFENTTFADNALDLVITNVPFGQIPIVDKRYEKNHVIHDYFIKRSLDLVHDGGFVAVITSTATMDKKDSRLRQEISKQANLITAARLPKNAFSAIAGTDVTSDILIFQKTSTPELNPEWIETTPLEDGKGNLVHLNKYFEKYTDHILGDIKIETFNGGTLSVTPEFSLEELPYELRSVLFESRIATQYFESKEKVKDILLPQTEKQSDEQLNLNIAPYTIAVKEGVPYYHNGDKIIKHQKTASLTLQKDEKRAQQLQRYEKIENQIYDHKTTYKKRLSGKGYFDSWSNFIFTPAQANSPEIPREVLEILSGGKNQLTNEGYRYTVEKGKDGLLTLTIEEAVQTKYFHYQDYSKKDIQAIDSMVNIRQTLQEVLNIQHSHNLSQPEHRQEYEELRLKLNTQYDAFVKAHGAISSKENASLMRKDDYYALLSSIENEEENYQTKEKEYTKAPVFFEPTIQPLTRALHFEDPHDALLASLNHRGEVNFDYMQDLTGQSRETLLHALTIKNQIFYEGNDKYSTREEYLSGDVKTKLEIAQANKEFKVEDYNWSNNIRELEKVIPADLTLSEINYKFGTRFIPLSIYKRYLAEQFEQKRYHDTSFNPDWVTIDYDRVGDSYKVSVVQQETYGIRDKYGVYIKKTDQRYLGTKLATELLNLRDPKLYMPDPNDPTQKKRILDIEATEAIQEKGELLSSNFKEWVLKNPDIQSEIVAIYNKKFNRYVNRSYDGSQLTVSGLAKQFSLRPHQANAVMRAVIEERAGFAHEVGAGKTLTLLASAKKLKELGKVNKPLCVIPKPLVEQFGKEIYQYFPESHVLIARSEDFKKENRKRLISRIMTGDYDFIVVADSQFGKISMSKEYQENYLLRQLEEERSNLENFSEKNFTVKKIEQRIKALERNIEELQSLDTDSFIDFEDLGVDLLIVDEAHNYKNLAPLTQLENVKGVSDTRSKKAMDLQQKAEYLQSQYNNRRVIFSTGTPLSNSVVEMYTMMKYIEPDVLNRYGVSSFDSWVSTFGIIENNFELTAAGTFKVNRRFVKFGNMQELMNMFRETWDIQTASMLDLPVPQAEIISHASTVTEQQRAYIQSLVQRASDIESGLVKPTEDNMLKIIGENKKLTLDLRALDDQRFKKSDSEKLQQVIENTYKIYTETAEELSTQLIFLDMSVPVKYRSSSSKNLNGTTNTFSAYDEIKQELISKGVAEEEIRFIHEATDKNKERMMQEMRQGKIRILIGSTGKAGTGLNVQDKLIAVHHLDVPWRPSDTTQRNGRIIRQGNENSTVQIHYYITKGSMDSFLWQTQDNKVKFIEQIMSGESDAREMEELETSIPSPAFFSAFANENPLQAEFIQLRIELQTLERSRNRFYEEQTRNKERLSKEKEQLPKFELALDKKNIDYQKASETKHLPFELTLHYKDKSQTFREEDKKSDVALALVGCINTSISESQMSLNKEVSKIASYRGFDIYHNPSGAEGGQEANDVHLFIKGEAQYSTLVSLESPTGILTRLNNKIDDGILRSKETTEQEIRNIKSAVAEIENSGGSKFPNEELYFTKKERHKELKALLQQQKTSDLTNIRDVTDDYDMEM